MCEGPQDLRRQQRACPSPILTSLELCFNMNEKSCVLTETSSCMASVSPLVISYLPPAKQQKAGVELSQGQVRTVHEGGHQPELGSRFSQRGLKETALGVNFKHLPPRPKSSSPPLFSNLGQLPNLSAVNWRWGSPPCPSHWRIKCDHVVKGHCELWDVRNVRWGWGSGEGLRACGGPASYDLG